MRDTHNKKEEKGETKKRKKRMEKGKLRRLESWQEINLMPATNLLGRGPSDSQMPGQKVGTDQLQMLQPFLRRGGGREKGPAASSRANIQLAF